MIPSGRLEPPLNFQQRAGLRPGGTYDGLLHEVVEHVDSDTLVTEYTEYSELGMPTEIVHPSTAVETLEYDLGGMRIHSRTLGGLTATYSYTAGGRLDVVVEGDGPATKYVYDALGRIWKIQTYDDDSLTGTYDETVYAYDDAGRRTDVTVSRSTGGTAFEWSATYDDHGYMDSETLGPREATMYTLDELGLGRVEELDRGDGDIEEFDHDAFGREIDVIRHFDGMTSGTFSLGHTATTGLEVREDRPSSVEDPLETERDYEYDDFGRLIVSTSDDYGTQRWAYEDGLLQESKLPSGRRTEYTYDDLGRVTLIDHDADNPTVLGQDYGFTYDNGSSTCNIDYGSIGLTECEYRIGRLASVDIEYTPGNFWTVEYDYTADGQVQAELYPSGRQTTYEHKDQRLWRLWFPLNPGDYLQYDRNGTISGMDPSEVSDITDGYAGVDWAHEIERDAQGRLTYANFDSDGGGLSAAGIAYRTDGAEVGFEVIRRTGSSSYADAAFRLYSYADDGMTTGYTSYVTGDPDRTFFYDGANRLVCATGVADDTACPSAGTSTLVESYAYDEAGNRIATATSASGTATDYDYDGNALDLETPPSGTIDYDYEFGTGGARLYDDDSGTDGERTYYYDGIGRLRTVDLTRPGASEMEEHQITILYDQRSRPILVADVNVDDGDYETDYEMFWDREDRLIARVTTPDAASSGDRTEELYAHIEPIAVGVLRLLFKGDEKISTDHLYDLRDPVGLPIVRFQPSGTTSTVLWTGEYAPFGEVVAETGSSDERPPWRFLGQLELPGSASLDASGNLLRSPLYLNQWRVYDPRVGQYLTAEPLAILGAAPGRSSYAYPPNPYNTIDPTGLYGFGVDLRGSSIIGEDGTIGGINFQYTSSEGFGAYAILPGGSLAGDGEAESGSGFGFLPGIAVTASAVCDEGGWAGEFTAAELSALGATGSLFGGPGGKTFGISGGASIGPPGGAYTRTNYKPIVRSGPVPAWLDRTALGAATPAILEFLGIDPGGF